MNYLREKRESLGLTLKEVGEQVGVHFTTVADWEKGNKGPKPKNKINLAKALGCTVDELFERPTQEPTIWEDFKKENEDKKDFPDSPFAKYFGELTLGSNAVDCYVLDTGERVVSMGAAVTALAKTKSADLAEYIGVNSLKPYINKDLVLAETIIFNIPGSGYSGRGIKAETFLDICNAYVMAFSDGALSTTKQQQIAMRCSVLLASCAKVGLIALIDEATGYQYERAEDALQLKLRAFVADEIRAWEKTFPDELWEQFGRLTQWKGNIHSRPKWWGKLVMDLIYNALDADVAKYLKDNKPPPVHRHNYHQWLSANYGLKELITHINEIIGIAKTCTDIKELKYHVSKIYKHEPMQLSLLKEIKGISK